MNELPEYSKDKAVIRILQHRVWPLMDVNSDEGFLRRKFTENYENFIKQYLSNKEFHERQNEYKDYVDQYFVTTDKNNIQTSIPRNKLNFIPVPCSNTTENLNLYQTRNHEFDIFYAVSHGVNRGILKKNKIFQLIDCTS